MREAYLADEEDPLDGFEFLTMAEAGEVGHWSIVAKLNEKAGNAELRTLTDWALPIQQRHLQEVLDGSLKLAADEDPTKRPSRCRLHPRAQIREALGDEADLVEARGRALAGRRLHEEAGAQLGRRGEREVADEAPRLAVEPGVQRDRRGRAATSAATRRRRSTANALASSESPSVMTETTPASPCGDTSKASLTQRALARPQQQRARVVRRPEPAPHARGELEVALDRAEQPGRAVPLAAGRVGEEVAARRRRDRERTSGLQLAGATSQVSGAGRGGMAIMSGIDRPR